MSARINAIESTFSSPLFANALSAAQSAGSAGPTAYSPTPSAPSSAVLGMGTNGAVAAAPSTPDPASLALEDQVVARARDFIGVPYVWGAEQADAVDCSGLMLQVFNHFGIELPRVSRDQAQAGTAVPREDLRPGDMVFFDYSTSRPGVDHVGLYIGDGKMIHAPRPGSTVSEAPVDWSAFTGARRVLPAAQGNPGTATSSPATVDIGPLATAMLPPAGKEWAAEIATAARTAGIDPNLLAAVVWSESAFNTAAKSPAGAIGLGQLMPGTAAGLGVNPHDPVQNLRGAATYLADQLDRFGSTELALAAYNAGPGNVDKYGGVPPFAETQGYVAAVAERYRLLEAGT